MSDNAQMRECAQEEQKPAAKQSDDELERLRARVAELEAERDEREKQEPVAWYIDGEDGREYNGTPKMSGGRIGTPLCAAPPVITQHEPVTTVEDRYNADGKSCHITDDLPAGMPLYAAPPVTEQGCVTVTTDESGRAVAVTRQDDEGRILSVIWEAGEMEKPVNARMVEAAKALVTIFTPLARDSTSSEWIDKARDALSAAEAQQAGPNTDPADRVNRAFQDGINSGYAQAMMDEMARHRQSEPVRLTDERIFDICKSMLVEGYHGDYLENDGFELAKEIEAETLRANGFKVEGEQ